MILDDPKLLDKASKSTLRSATGLAPRRRASSVAPLPETARTL